MKQSIRLIFFPILVSIMACQQQMPENAQWDGSAQVADGKSLPFHIRLNFNGSIPSGSFVVGDETIPIPEISRHGDSLSFIFSEYGAAMRGIWSHGEWSGLYLRYRSDTTSFAFSAKPSSAQSGKSVTSAPANIPLVGTYQVYFQRDKAIDSATTAHFWLKGDSINGTFIAPDGDYGLHVGKQSGNTVQLSRFTGWQAMMIEATLQDGRWSGKHYVRKDPPRSFTLESRPSLPKESLGPKHTAMINPKAPFHFQGVQLGGDTLNSNDPRFAGKALIVDIMGTWCHNCMDESPLLQRLYSEFHNDGLEIVGLSLENKEDFELAKKNISLYRDRFGITFPLLYCGTTDDANTQARLHSQLKDFFAYPTALFIDRKGNVRSVHPGFKGPGTGDEYQNQVQEFYQIVRSLVKESLSLHSIK